MYRLIFSCCLLTLVFLGGCITTRGSKDNPYDRNQVVHKTNGEEVLTQLSRDYWIQIRTSASSDQMKLYSSLGTKEWDAAINDARAYLQGHPKDRVALIVLATALAMKQNYSLAAYYGELLLNYYPEFPETSNLIGLAILNRTGATYQDYRKAASFFERAFDTHSNQVASGLNLGYLHLEMANAESARDVFQIVRNRCNDCITALLGYGIAASRLKQFNEAEKVFAAILEKEPLHAEAIYYRALVAAYGKKDEKQAIKLLSDLMEHPDQENLEVKRKANFLLRRLEAKTYATENRKQDTQVSETIMEALDVD